MLLLARGAIERRKEFHDAAVPAALADVVPVPLALLRYAAIDCALRKPRDLCAERLVLRASAEAVVKAGGAGWTVTPAQVIERLVTGLAVKDFPAVVLGPRGDVLQIRRAASGD